MEKNIGKLKVQPRVRASGWSILNKGIPMRSKLSKRDIKCTILCLGCLTKEENLDHLFKSCDWANKIWFGSKLNLNFHNNLQD